MRKILRRSTTGIALLVSLFTSIALTTPKSDVPAAEKPSVTAKVSIENSGDSRLILSVRCDGSFMLTAERLGVIGEHETFIGSGDTLISLKHPSHITGIKIWRPGENHEAIIALKKNIVIWNAAATVHSPPF